VRIRPTEHHGAAEHEKHLFASPLINLSSVDAKAFAPAKAISVGGRRMYVASLRPAPTA
jgi:hypothetical protein